MNFNPATPNSGPPGNIVTPPGWRAEWSAQYSRYFYVNVNTNESTWSLPASPPVQQFPQSIQRKPVPGQPSPSSVQGQTPGSMTQTPYVEAYPTPPPQVTGYFPATSSPQQQQYSQAPEVVQNKQQPQAQYPNSPVAVQQQQNPQQQYPQAVQQQQPQYVQTQGVVQQNYSPAPQQQPQAPPQQRVYTPPSAGPSNTSPQYFQQNVQTFSPPLTPNAQPVNNYTPSPQNYPQANMAPPAQFPPQQRAAPGYYVQQQTPFAQPPQQYQQQPQYQPQPQQQPQQQYPYPNQAQQPQHQAKRSSMMGSNFLNNPMMTKMSKNFPSLQKGGPSTSFPSPQNPNAKPTDWMKWGKRAAIGVAGISALALGVDAGADMFSGAEGLSGGTEGFCGGGDFSGGGGGDAAAVMDAQTAVDANYAQLSIEQMGQENASMLADPVGTTYIQSAEQTQSVMGLI